MNILGTITTEDFLSNYWEKKPLVIRGAYKDSESISNIDDLIHMACDNYYESRMIKKEKDKEKDVWSVETGPFNKKEFKNKSAFWTLIIHNLNLYLPKARILEKAVEFIPKWLFDDVMCTYSTEGSSVGAHIDNYNVFILQGSGKRSWSIEYKPNKEFQEGLEVKILKEFNPDETFILEPGDMIYIPPHVAHAGESLTESVSYSIGFKSLEDKPMLNALSLKVLEELQSEDFYKTSFDKATSNSFEVLPSFIEKIKNRLNAQLFEPDFFNKYLLGFLSHSKSFVPGDDNTDVDFKEFTQLLATHELCRDEHTRMAYTKEADKFIVSINEFIFEIDSGDLTELTDIFNQAPNTKINIKSEFSDLYYQLFQEGLLYVSE